MCHRTTALGDLAAWLALTVNRLIIGASQNDPELTTSVLRSGHCHLWMRTFRSWHRATKRSWNVRKLRSMVRSPSKWEHYAMSGERKVK
jgi:hypothetical protein